MEKFELVDFLYIDKDRIFNYYAQMFEGVLKNISQKESVKENKEEKVTAGFKPIAEGTLQGNTEILKEENKEIDPERAIILDIITYLSNISKDITQAKINNIVKVNGDLFIAAKNILKIFSSNIDASLLLNKPNPTNQEKKEIKKIQQLIKIVSETLQIEPIFILKNNSTIVGSIQEKYLNELPDTFQLKYGANGLKDVYIIGIYEGINNNINPQSDINQDFIRGSAQFAEALKNMFLPYNAYQITPIAIYRKIQ
jgi:hypothetical protein